MNERPLNIPNSENWETFRHVASLADGKRQGLHRLVFLASQLIHTPIAFITLVEGDRQVLGAQIGLSQPLPAKGGLPGSLAISGILVNSGEPLLIHSSDDHEHGQALEEIGGGKSAAFLGFPLREADGVAFGSFGIVDLKPRTWQPGEVGLLSELSALAAGEIAAQVAAREHEALREHHTLLCQRLAEAEQARATFESRLPRVQRLASLGTLACGVAHEFNNLLGAIIGNATRAKFHALHGEISMDPIDDVLQASQRAREVVRQVLGYGRDQAATRQTIRLEPLLSECVGLLRSTLPRGVELTLACNPDTPPILGDPTQITQAVMNLVTNAWHALDHRSGRVEIALEPSTPTSLPAAPYRPGLASHACISVSDNGKGMDAGTLQRIFEPFFTTKGPDEGAGLGLSIVQSIVQEHGGEVRVRSQLGQGTTFTLLFPSAASQSPTKSESHPRL
ncbi:MAG: GAF domain-containing protein [Verrucomicrobiales bacterium]|nr:GAF domain-containing protein [Verrucomicrobiales bacterium]